MPTATATASQTQATAPASPSGPPSPATPSAGASGTPSGSDAVPPAGVPPLLEWVGTGADRGLWRVDAAGRSRISLPAGEWVVTAGSRHIFLASRSGPATILVGRVSGMALETTSRIDLPGGDGWTDAFAACESPGGRVAVANGGGPLSIVENGRLRELPDQRLNLGGCAWLDESHVVWDREDGALMSWDASSGVAASTSIAGRSPSAADGVLSYFDTASGHVAVQRYELRETTVTLGMSIGTVSAGAPGMSSISSDGRWLLVSGFEPGSVGVFAIGSGLVLRATLPIEPGGVFGWLPGA